MHLADGVVWQPSAGSATPAGEWHRLGAHELLVQWTAVDDVAYVPGTSLRAAQPMPDWGAIATQPWARQVVLGLAGRFDGLAARRDLELLGTQALLLTRHKPDAVRVAGWYFPVEADPTWSGVRSLLPILSRLPRPLWVSAFDNGNIGPAEFATWLREWLPADVGVYFQDGVGIHTRRPEVALLYDDALVARLGRGRVRLIAEAFRVQGLNRFGPASAGELLEQLRIYKGRPVHLFEGPQYVSQALVTDVVNRCASTSC